MVLPNERIPRKPGAPLAFTPHPHVPQPPPSQSALLPEVCRCHARASTAGVLIAARPRSGTRREHPGGSGGHRHASVAHGVHRQLARLLPTGVLANTDGPRLRPAGSLETAVASSE